MADKYHSIHTGQAIDSAVTKALNPSTTFNSEDAGKLADAKAVGELVTAEKDRAEATYLPYDGYSQLARVGEADVADNLTPYSSDSGTEQNTPFILQGSGCANGEEQADTGSYCQLKEKRGNTVVVNQLIRNNNFETATVWIKNRCRLSVSANVGIAECTDISASSISIYQRPVGVAGHKYLLGATVKCETTNPATLLYLASSATIYSSPVGNNRIENPVQNMWYSLSFIGALNEGATVYCIPSLYSNELVLGDKLYIKNTYAIDLTLWFGSNDKIPTHLLNHPEDFFRYYQGSLAYNEGTLTDCNGRYLKTWKRNVWDEQWESGSYAVDTGLPYSDNTRIRAKNYVRCIPNMPYYVRTNSKTIGLRFYDANKTFLGSNTNISIDNGQRFTAPANACYFRFTVVDETTYHNDITISLYYEDESGYDQYYPYEELANIDTGNEELLAFDYKTPDGTIHRETGRVDLGTLNWTAYSQTSNAFYCEISDLKSPSVNTERTTGLYCSKYPVDANTSFSDIWTDKTCKKSTAARFYARDSAFDGFTVEQVKAAMSGVYLEYELAEPTTEQGTPFPENVAIDDFGTMAFDCPNGVPQGNTVFYPVDYKAEIDTLHNITDGDMHKIALKGELAPTDPDTIKGVIDAYNALYAINQENMGGTLRHILADKANIDFANTAYIDLGERSWQKFETVELGVYYGFDLPERKSGSLNIVASKYATYSSTGVSGMPDKYITSGTGNTTVYLKDSSYTDATTLKTALKGILLAYEKATT